MKTRSIWEETKTFFPLFLKRIEEFFVPAGPICIVGASDGKFVIPLAERGWRVIAIEVDNTALYGGMVKFPDGEMHEIAGLLRRLEMEGLTNIEVILSDFLVCRPSESCVGVFTSCSWHYSRNHKRPLGEFVSRMQSLLAPGGLFCAEYMMPCEPKHAHIEHYVGKRELLKFFQGWDVLEEFYTPVFSEKAHAGNLVDHIHRMGFLMARKTSVTVL